MDNRCYVKQATAVLLGLSMAQGVASAESKFLSLFTKARKMRWVMTGLLLFVLASCANNTTGENDFSNIENRGGVHPGEVIVRLCPDKDNAHAQQLLKQHQLSLLHRASPTLWTLGWQDERSIDQIISVLKNKPSIFCAVQPNYQYKASDVNNREKIK